MAAANFNIRALIFPPGKARMVAPRRKEFFKRIDFSKQNLAQNQDAAFLDLPAGFILDRVDPILRVAQGAPATLNVGVDGTIQAFVAACNVNSTPNTRLSIGSPGYSPGQYFHTDTEVRVNVPNTAATLTLVVIDIIISGFLIEPSLEFGPLGVQL